MYLEFARRADLWQFLTGTLLATALISGAYPAFYVASFKPVAIFTGKLKSGGPNRFMQSLLTVQFVLAFVTMIMCVGFTMNFSYLKNLDWGYDNSNTLVIRLDPESYDFMYDAASQLAQVEYVSGAMNHVGSWNGDRSKISRTGIEEQAVRFVVGNQYFDIIRPHLLAGEFPTLPNHILINASLASRLGENSLVGQSVTYGDAQYQVSGVVNDFHYSTFSDLIEPAMFLLGDPQEFGYLLARVRAGTEEGSCYSTYIGYAGSIPGLWSKLLLPARVI